MPEIRALHSNELTNWCELGAALSGLPDEHFSARFYNDPDADLAGMLVALIEDKFVGMLHVLRRKVYISGEAILVGGIGELYVRAEHAGPGIAHGLLLRAMDYMRTNQLHISMLLLTAADRDCTAHDWHTIAVNRQIIDVAELPEHTPRGILRPMREADWQQIRGLYSLRAPGLTGSIVRDKRKYWEAWVRSSWAAEGVYVYERDNRIRAYMQVKQSLDPARPARIGEFAALPDEDSLLRDMLCAAHAQGILAKASIHSALCPQGLGTMGIETDHRLRVHLNAPFMACGQAISSDAELATALANACIMDADDF